jgi:hypothetical protein
MEMDQICGENVAENTEDAWIEKYRSSVKVPTIQQSRLMKVREAIHSAYNIVMLRAHKILNRWTQVRMQKPALSQPMLVPEPQTLALTTNDAATTRPKMNQATAKKATIKKATMKKAESSAAPRSRRRRQPRQVQGQVQELPASTTEYRAG